MNNRDIAVRSFFDQAQVRSTARVDPIVATTLFSDATAAMRPTIRINQQTFEITGARPTSTRSSAPMCITRS